MMRGPSYDENYISRKMNSFQSAPTFSPPTPSYGYMQGYNPAPPRLPPRMGPPPPYYDYDYGGYGGGYGGYGGYGGGYGGYRPYGGGGYGYGYAPPPPPPVPRYRNYEPYLEDDYDLNYVPRYRPRYSDSLVEVEKDKMLQDQVDKMRTRLQAMSFSLDPSGPVPEIVIPERSRRVDSGKDFSKKYSSALELTELPRLSVRKHHQYPEDAYMKDNLRIKCLSHYKTTRTAAEYWKPKGYYGDDLSTSYTLPSYSSKYSKTRTGGTEGSGSKWEEPDTVYSSSVTENKPFSKVETGSSFYSTHGYTNRKKDSVLKKVHDYYYDNDASTKPDGSSYVRFSESSLLKSSEGDDDDLKSRRKKKKSKERDEPLAIDSSAAADSSTATPAAAAAAAEVSSDVAASTEPTPAAADSAAAPAPAAAAAAPAEPETELDEKEKKRLEKKKRKAEREAAAKAAMEAELEALAEAELELARLEAESASLKAAEPKTEPAAAPTASDASPAPATDAKDSEKATEK